MIARPNMLAAALATAMVGGLVASGLPNAQNDLPLDVPSVSTDQSGSRGARSATAYIDGSSVGSPSGRGPGRGARSTMPSPETVAESPPNEATSMFIRGARAETRD